MTATDGFWDSVQAFGHSASSGHFAVSPEGGEALLRVISDFLDEMDTQEINVRLIAAPPPLGRLQGGLVMSPFMVQVATDADGFATRLLELQSSLRAAEAAIKVAMANYQATEQANTDALRESGTGAG
jgi:hypothetical protein